MSAFANAQSALRKLERSRHARRGSGCIHFSYGQVEIALTAETGAKTPTIYIDYIANDGTVGKGHGSRALRSLCDWADEYGITLVLMVFPFDHKTLSSTALKRWYKRRGFRQMRKQPDKDLYYMTRSPGAEN